MNLTTCNVAIHMHILLTSLLYICVATSDYIASYTIAIIGSKIFIVKYCDTGWVLAVDPSLW